MNILKWNLEPLAVSRHSSRPSVHPSLLALPALLVPMTTCSSTITQTGFCFATPCRVSTSCCSARVTSSLCVADRRKFRLNFCLFVPTVNSSTRGSTNTILTQVAKHLHMCVILHTNRPIHSGYVCPISWLHDTHNSSKARWKEGAGLPEAWQ